MPLTTAGKNHIATAIVGGSLTAFNNANAYLGVGNGTTAFSAAHTDLQGASKTRKGMEATFPTDSGAGVLVFKSSFGSGDANHAWDEWGVFNNSSGGTMLCRKVDALGTKTTGTWVLTGTVTVSIGS